MVQDGVRNTHGNGRVMRSVRLKGRSPAAVKEYCLLFSSPERHGTKALAMSNEIPVLIGWCKNKRIETGREILI